MNRVAEKAPLPEHHPLLPERRALPDWSFPPWLRTFAQVNLEMHAVKAVLFRNGDLAAASGHVGLLGAFVVLMLKLSTLTMRRSSEEQLS